MKGKGERERYTRLNAEVWRIARRDKKAFFKEQWMKVRNTVQEAITKIIPKKKKYKMLKWLSEEDLQIAEKRREVKGKREKKRCSHPFLRNSDCRVPKNSKKR